MIVPNVNLPTGTPHDSSPHGVIVPTLSIAQTIEAEQVLERDAGQIIGRNDIGKHRQEAAVALCPHQRRRIQAITIQAGVPLVVTLADDQHQVHRIDGTGRITGCHLPKGAIDCRIGLIGLESQREDGLV